MNITDFDLLGYYNPGFLHLRVNTDEPLKDLNLLASDPVTAHYFSTFFHEYIHFLQDITTSNGLISSVHMIDVLKEFIWQVKNDGQAEFQTPVTLDHPSNMGANNRLILIYRGESPKVSRAEYNHYDEEFESITDKDGTVFNVAKYKVSYFEPTGPVKSFYFGTTCIKEFVTHTLQSKFARGTIHRDIPYQIAGKIMAKEFPELAADPMMMVALCDASLLSLNPPQMFFNLIKRMKEKGFIPQSAMDIYGFMHDDVTFDGPSGNFDLDQLIDFQMDLTLKQLSNALQSDIFEPNLRWITHIFNEAYQLRKEIPDFMTRLVDGEGQLSPFFYTVFYRIGTPFFTNKKEEGGFIPPRTIDPTGIQPYQLLVFREIIMVFSGQRYCNMYNFCKTHSGKDITNELCLTAPWKRGVADELCPFGQFWKTWGLNGEVPVKT